MWFLLQCLTWICMINVVSVSAKGKEAMDGGLLAGVIIVILITIFALVVLVIVFVRLRKGKTKTLIVNEEPRSTRPPIILPEHPIRGNKDNNNTLPLIMMKKEENVVSARRNSPKKEKVPGHRIKVSEVNTVMKAMSDEDMDKEFRTIPKGQTKPWHSAEKEDLKPKNKYKNILPYDFNRVVLDKLKGNSLSHYINASFIPNFEGSNDKMFIASQGPREASKDDFWRMIWQYNIRIIVMVTKCIEGMKIKCEQYWPKDDPLLTLGGVSISIDEEKRYSDITIRQLKAEKGGETRMIHQYHYTTWPDHDVADSTSGIFKMRQLMREKHVLYKNSPVLVHCSAGVGRSGTFISLDHLMVQIEKEKCFDVLGTVRTLRDHRVDMVQTQGQYRFIYKAIHERLIVGETEIEISAAKATLQNLLHSASGKEKLRKQYQFLEDTKPDVGENECKDALSKRNSSKNRQTTIIPADKHRVILESRNYDEDDYINAVHIKNHGIDEKYVVTQEPLEATLDDFWTLVSEQEVNAIVYICKEGHEGKWLPKENDTIRLGRILSVKSDDIPNNKGALSHLHVLISSEGEAATGGEGDATLYANVGPEATQQREAVANATEYANTAPRKLHIFMAHVTSAVDKETTRSLQKLVAENTNSHQTIAVVCWDGATESGLFIATDLIKDSLKSRTGINIFNIVQKIRKTRPQLIPTIEQYLCLHEIALEALNTD